VKQEERRLIRHQKERSHSKGKNYSEEELEVKTEKIVIQLKESDEGDTSSIKWKDYKIEALVAIRGKMDEESVITTNKQGMNFFWK